mmetsp:Transcript_39096/g.110732  ORF Transcript_39096/g.110732 Transcript_39096/m.110732 type:complete len:760 (-) Transcript_39096:44-2323(-)
MRSEEPAAGGQAPNLVAMCNRILAAAGLVGTVYTEEDVRVICSQTSLFVAACEAIIRRPMEDINRRPLTDSDRASNNGKVIDIIANILHTDLGHISGQRIAFGDLDDIRNLVEIVAALSFVKSHNVSSSAGDGFCSSRSVDMSKSTTEASGWGVTSPERSMGTVEEEGEEEEQIFDSGPAMLAPFQARRGGRPARGPEGKPPPMPSLRGAAVAAAGQSPPSRRRGDSSKRIMREAEESLSALESEVSELETSVFGERRTAPPRSHSARGGSRPRSPVAIHRRPPMPMPSPHPPPAREPRAAPRPPRKHNTTKFNAPRLATARRAAEREANIKRRQRQELVGRPLRDHYTRADMNAELERRALRARQEAASESSQQRREERLARILAERLQEEEMAAAAAAGERSAPDPPDNRPLAGVAGGGVRLRKQAKKVQLAYGSGLSRLQPGYDRASTPAQWTREVKKRAFRAGKLRCPYPKPRGTEALRAEEEQDEQRDAIASVPMPSKWQASQAELFTEGMQKKLRGLQCMKNRDKLSHQAKRVLSLRRMEEVWRHAARKEIWLRQHWAERRKSMQDINRRLHLEERAHKFKEKVESLRHERFLDEGRRQRESRRFKWASRDRRILREMFQTAVELEKEHILEEHKQLRERTAAAAKREGKSNKPLTAASGGGHCERLAADNWRMLSEALASERQQRNIGEHGQDELVRMLDKEWRRASAQWRRKELARVADKEEAHYWQAVAHPRHEGEWFSRIWHSASQYKA